MNSETESKFHDRARELFGAAWGNVVVSLIGAVTATWFWVELFRTDGRVEDMRGPLTWLLARLADLGIAQPDWLRSYSEWRPHGSANGIEWLLVILAVAFSVKASLVKPGYLIVGELLLLSSAEWYGVASVVGRYLLVALILLAIASLCATGQWIASRSRTTVKVGWSFTAESVLLGFIGGPGYLLLWAPALPVFAAWSVLSSFGWFRDERAEPATVALLRETLRALERHPGPLADLPAAKHAQIKAAIALISADRDNLARSVGLLSYRLRNPMIRRLPRPEPGLPLAPPVRPSDRVGGPAGTRTLTGREADPDRE